MFSQHVLQTRSDQYDFVDISVIEGCVPVLFPSAATIVVNASVFTQRLGITQEFQILLENRF